MYPPPPDVTRGKAVSPFPSMDVICGRGGGADGGEEGGRAYIRLTVGSFQDCHSSFFASIFLVL